MNIENTYGSMDRVDRSGFICIDLTYFLKLIWVKVNRIQFITHSDRNDSTGFILAALTDWKPTVSKAITMVSKPAPIKYHHSKSIL